MRRLKNGCSVSPPPLLLPKSKNVAPSRKKSRFSGKNSEKLREVDLPLIDLGLREVGVDRQVRAQARRRVVEDIDAGVRASDPASIAAARHVVERRERRTASRRGRAPGSRRVMPISRPALVMRRSPWLRAQPVQMLSSFLRRTVRWKLMPHVVAVRDRS